MTLSLDIDPDVLLICLCLLLGTVAWAIKGLR